MASEYEQLSRDLPSTMGTAAIAGAIAAEEEAEARRRESHAAPAGEDSRTGQTARGTQPASDGHAAKAHPPEAHEPPEPHAGD